jgi:integrase
MDELFPIYEHTKDQDTGTSWATWRAKKDGAIPTEQEIVNMILRAAKLNLDHGFILAVLYLTASRVAEICPYKYTGIEEDKINITRPALQWKNIVPEEDHATGEKVINIYSRVNKVFKASSDMTTEERFKKLSKYPYKLAPIPYEEDAIWFPLLRIIETYLETVLNPTPDIELVKLKRRAVGRITHKYMGINCHMIRHWRCKILVRDYKYTPQDLQAFCGWVSAEMPMYYSRSDIDTMKRKLRDKNI